MRKVLFILGQLFDEDISWMASVGNRVSVAKDTVIIPEGVPNDYMYIIIEGSCKVTSEKTGDLAQLQRGEILGEMSFVETSPPLVSAIASEESILLKIPHSAFHERMKESPAFAARMYRAIAVFLSDRLRGTVSRLGYGKLQNGNMNDECQHEEIDLEVLDKMQLAGKRFDQMIKTLNGI